MTNHAHILLRSGPYGLSKCMQRFLIGYAITYNRRHRRYGHLFQNRYKSIVCDEDSYFRELVRYIHLRGDESRQEVVEFVEQVCKKENINSRELRMGSRRGRICQVRSQIAYQLVEDYGLPLAQAARQLGVSTSAISKTITRRMKE
jgi:hypothetical protein